MDVLSASRIDSVPDRRAVVAREWHARTGGRCSAASQSAEQRPNQIELPGLPARQWWDPASFPFVRDLEAASAEISREVFRLRAAGYLRPRPIASIPAAERFGDQLLIDGDEGGWEIFRLFYNGLWFEQNCALCPVTVAAVRAVPRLAGTIGIGVLLGGTRVHPHCGLSNAKLRCHLGLSVPSGCGLRVGAETRTWEEGRCLIFDDSFEHSVWNESDQPRYVLMLDVYHPTLDDADVEWIASRSEVPASKRQSVRAKATWTR